jgi:CheY-like chemotaxis protein
MAVILHVEDDAPVRFLYKEVFEELGYEIIQANSAEEAFQILRKKKPDIIILDLKMPGMGGKGFLDKFHRMKMQIPIVVSTAYPYMALDTTSLDADAYVVKSGDMAELVEKVNGLIKKKVRPGSKM